MFKYRSSSSHVGKRKGSGQANGASESVIAYDSSDLDYPNQNGDDFNGRNGAHRFVKAALPGKKSKVNNHASKAYIETRYSEHKEYKSSGMSDTSETVSLSKCNYVMSLNSY